MEILRTEGLTINFDGLKAVDGIDLVINYEVVGLIGPNGSGKTTFLNLISGIYKPTTGRIIIDNEDVTGAGANIIRSKGISRTFQTNRLCIDLSVIDNVLLGIYSKQKSSWWHAVFQPSRSRRELKDGIEKCIAAMAHFNPALVGKRYDPISTLPLIDRRRIEIARAMVGDPKVLLLDEPTAGLNREETKQMISDISRIRENNSNMCIIIIEHDMAVIEKISSRVVVFNAGRVIADDCFVNVLKNELVCAAYLGG